MIPGENRTGYWGKPIHPGFAGLYIPVKFNPGVVRFGYGK
jgi:hypothetical protein